MNLVMFVTKESKDFNVVFHGNGNGRNVGLDSCNIQLIWHQLTSSSVFCTKDICSLVAIC